MITPSERTEQLVGACVALVFGMACLGVISSIMWYNSAQEVKALKLKTAAQVNTIQFLTGEVEDKRHKISQANRLLAVAYPESRMDFLSED